MKRTLLMVSMVAVALGLYGAAVADEGHGGKEISVQGEVLDMACYVAQEAKGADHAKCAKQCVKGGQPMGLLGSDGTVYLLYASHKSMDAFQQAKNHAGEKVEIKGMMAERVGIKGIEVHSVKAM